MNNDLISREALKNEIEKVSRFNDGTYKWLHLNGVYNAIDNAPAIETTKAEHKAYNEGFKDGVNQGIKLSERPQGKWLKDYVHFKCSNCGEEAPYIYPNEHERFIEVRTNYCPHCGARMGE